MDICHRDGDRTHNAVSNLYYGSRSQNELDKVKHGTHQNASKTRCKNGHEFTPENTRLRIKKSGGTERVCHTCTLIRAAEQRRRNRG